MKLKYCYIVLLLGTFTVEIYYCKSCFANDIIKLRTQISNIKMTYQPDPSANQLYIDDNKNKLDEIIHKVMNLNPQTRKKVCPVSDIKYLQKIQMYYLGIKVFHYGIDQPLEHFYRSYCTTKTSSLDKWCQSVKKNFDQKDSQPVEVKIFNFKNMIKQLSVNETQVNFHGMFPWFSFSNPVDLEKDTLNLVISISKHIRKEMKFNLRYDLYYAFGKLRQIQHRNEDYLQNICLAYIFGNICEKITILKEINTLKHHIFKDGPLEKNTVLYLTDAGLIQRWAQGTLLEGIDKCNCPSY